MKVVIVALALVAIAAAIPLENAKSQPAQILRSENEQEPGKGYKFGFASDDGTARDEEGTVVELPDEENKIHPVVIVRGSYTYTDPETGKQETITYEADQNGYHAYGDSIPKPNSRR